MAKAPVIEEAQLRHMLKVAAVSGESPVRNVALLTTIYGTGMMPTELARMPLHAFLNSDNTVREKSCVAAEIAFNGKERPLYWSNDKVVTAIKAFSMALLPDNGLTNT
ncbi:hypothetical protein [Pseudoduganella violacea]|uniref:Site-specific recombinase XerD n=1 Tax=Pseudoduganella violacea TaxID=1715466 RepID=A0A7W5BG23_9BURK|nr:hypothetical protein [Pseudoduganella violacea]MBB3122476.1 site-specific recombinase XerD [Pseudoduganella violacea]